VSVPPDDEMEVVLLYGVGQRRLRRTAEYGMPYEQSTNFYG